MKHGCVPCFFNLCFIWGGFKFVTWDIQTLPTVGIKGLYVYIKLYGSKKIYKCFMILASGCYSIVSVVSWVSWPDFWSINCLRCAQLKERQCPETWESKWKGTWCSMILTRFLLVVVFILSSQNPLNPYSFACYCCLDLTLHVQKNLWIPSQISMDCIFFTIWTTMIVGPSIYGFEDITFVSQNLQGSLSKLGVCKKIPMDSVLESL